MIKWLENYFKREDNKFMRVLQDSVYAEKYLSDLYQGRKTISIMFLVWVVLALLLLLLTIIFSRSDNSGLIFWMPAVFGFLYIVIDVQIKMILMINYIKSAFMSEGDTKLEQSEDH